MNYQQTLDFLFTQFPIFQNSGQSAYKPGLDNALALSSLFGDPHKQLRTIHIAGTNGKGSTAHTLAAILRSAGLRTGLFTSPHLVDFRERIRIDGEMISEDEVVDFVRRYRSLDSSLHPSFFELTTIMAFEWFRRNNVDVAVIEAGLGGRLDTTNIITPDLSVITNISFDHMALLGNTLEAIAGEKAGIIKPGIPAVIGEASGGVREVFARKAASVGAPVYFAEDYKLMESAEHTPDGWTFSGTPFGDLRGELAGDCQIKNAATIICAVLRLKEKGYPISDEAVGRGFSGVVGLTGLLGRWMKTGESPLTVCDTGHNVGGWQYISRQLGAFPGRKHLVVGFVNDKDVSGVLSMIRDIPGELDIIFTRASVDRALPAAELAARAELAGLHGAVTDSVADACALARRNASPADMIFVGGSTFVVADFLRSLA